jgi:hypothetical protein
LVSNVISPPPSWLPRRHQTQTGGESRTHRSTHDSTPEQRRDHCDPLDKGWLIFGLPPAEVAVHPAESHGSELYLMCRDLDAEMQRLTAQGVACSNVEEARWGAVTKIRLPGGGEVGLYQPRHPTMVDRP